MASDLTDRRAALRALLVEQVSAEASSTPRPPARRAPEPGRLRMTLVTGAVALVVVAASAVSLQLAGSSRPIAAAPAASTTGPTVPSEAPASAVPTGAPPTAEPPTPPAPTTVPPTSTPSVLVTPTGWHRITRAQLHAFVTSPARQVGDPANAAIWEAEMWLNVGCMAEHGFVFDPIAQATGPGMPQGLTPQQQADYEVAMYGPKTDQPYDWRTAGCDGAAVHAEGQDNAN